MSVIAFLPARGGSKGVPRKNVKILAGKPLIAWSIEQALASDLIDRVIVSTDCPLIARISKEYGAEVPFLRPESISGDKATTESAMLHCCGYLEERNELPELFILVQVTSPIRSENQFDNAILYFKKNNYDSLLTVVPSHRFTWKNPGNPSASYNYMHRPRRQDIKQEDQEYLETGSFYITKTELLIEANNRLVGKVGMFETPEDESYEIDSLVDFKVCEAILKNKNNIE
ncbi:cytidylyltransferase domain-containing protein [Glaciecola sp. 33A]|jgi:CMP-N,N'-diacetyllegionaminic acid synthase|uniref:acylneuraminate cytidylyltransferase family protein n=1 Tax=Glaciecola sp. 33A TaxID=2057807 RepID=UPI000C337F94|nr:acylneuraminate cytidylyltransferase family protein [Glaciecola sp. 33A]PKI02291.1 acylneuraminate cytidylyltransferase family protein [Glaciecola sp. 33A]